MSDLLSIFFSRISVSSLAKKNYVIVPNSKIILACLLKFYSLGYISSFKILNRKEILVILKYFENKPVLRKLVRLSKLSKRIYFNLRKMKQGFFLISTSRGILTDQECFFYNVGGEPLCLLV